MRLLHRATSLRPLLRLSCGICSIIRPTRIVQRQSGSQLSRRMVPSAYDALLAVAVPCGAGEFQVETVARTDGFQQ